MWRVTSCQRLANKNLTLTRLSDIQPCVVTAPLNGQFSTTTQRSLPAAPAGKTEGKSGGQESSKSGANNYYKYAPVGALGAAVVLVCGGGSYYAAYNEERRFWVIDKCPMTKGMFSSLGFSVDRPLSKVPKSGPIPTNIIDVADKTVSTINTNKALANDNIRKDASLKRGLEKMCKCEKKGNTELKKCHATNDSGSTVQSSSKDKRIEQVSFQQAGTDSVALVLANLKTPTPAELEKMTAAEEERHRQKMEETEKKNAEYIRKQEHKKQKKAAFELEKERQQENEQKQAVEAFQRKLQKNHDFELQASKRISEVMAIAEGAIKANQLAICTCREHTAKVREVMDVASEEDALPIWPMVHELNEMRLLRVAEAHTVQTRAEDVVLEYKHFIDNAKKDADTCKNENIPSYRRQIEKLAYEVKSIHDQLKSQVTVTKVMEHYYHLLRKDKDSFFKELAAIVPGQVKFGDKGFDLPLEELNSLLAHAHRRIFQLKHQLMEQQLLEHQRLEDALCEQKKNDMREANVKLGQDLDKQYEELILEKERELMGQDRKFESELKNKLARQASEHQDHLQDMLSLQQKKLMEQFDLALRERLIHSRHVFIDQISQHLAKVKGLEAALEERADMEKVITHVQDLMSGAMCLMHAVAHDIDCKGDNYQLMRIDEQVKKCFLAGEHNPFVEAVLHTIPTLAVERGIYSMSSLEQRFRNVYKQCVKAAAFPVDGNIITSGLAWIKYQFSSTPKPKHSIPCEFENALDMNSAELLEQAKYFMDKKCVAEAVRCMVQLDGKARLLAQDWIEEARLILEVRQASEVLLSYANSKGMGTIF